MKNNQPIRLFPTTTISIPVDNVVTELLRTMFQSKLGSIELKIDKTDKTGSQLVISCFLSNEASQHFNSLTQMYAVSEKTIDYADLKEIIIQILNDYLSLGDDDTLDNYNEEDDLEDWDDEDWDDDELRF
ncbi:MAG TPA: hypothetical protein PK733_10055 [Clostridiales bacterium]|nr:hypothetical protein [Clostridiales bacterium]